MNKLNSSFRNYFDFVFNQNSYLFFITTTMQLNLLAILIEFFLNVFFTHWNNTYRWHLLLYYIWQKLWILHNFLSFNRLNNESISDCCGCFTLGLFIMIEIEFFRVWLRPRLCRIWIQSHRVKSWNAINRLRRSIIL